MQHSLTLDQLLVDALAKTLYIRRVHEKFAISPSWEGTQKMLAMLAYSARRAGPTFLSQSEAVLTGSDRKPTFVNGRVRHVLPFVHCNHPPTIASSAAAARAEQARG